MKQMISVLAVAAGLACSAGAQVRFNESLINVPGGGDNGGEFIELISDAPSLALDAYTIVIIEGDAGAATGVVEYVLSLAGSSTGSNGLFLWRDAASVLQPAPEAATFVKVQDFSPDIENGSYTYLLVRDFTGALLQDLDTNDDGTLDLTPWSGVADAVAFLDNGNILQAQREYATQLGGTDITDYDPNSTTGFTPDSFVRTPCGWLSQDVLGLIPGPFFNDPDDTLFFPNVGQTVDLNFTLSPGSANFGVTCPPSGCEPDLNGDGNVDQGDVDCMVSVAAGDPACVRTDVTIDTDYNQDGNVDQGDVDYLINVVGGAPCN